MKRILLCLLALLAACVLLSACNRGKDSAPAPTPAPAAPTPAPTPTLPPYEPKLLTGEPRDADYKANQRPVAVMINNIIKCRPQRGLSDASVLTEIMVEGGITRFMAIFDDYTKIKDLGPVRSGRDQFFQLILPWQMLYAHEGQSSMMTYYSHNFSDYGYGKDGGYETVDRGLPTQKSINYGSGNLNHNHVGSDYLGYGYRDWSRRNYQGLVYPSLDKEHTLYTTGEDIGKYISDEGLDMNRDYGESTFLPFVDYRVSSERDLANSIDSNYPPIVSEGKEYPIVSDGEYVEITHSQSYRTRFVYDAASKQYKMQQYYSGTWMDTCDEGNNNVQLSFPNLLILFTDIHNYAGDSYGLKEVVYSTGGTGYYCYGGKCEFIFWQKPSPTERLWLFYADENGQCSERSAEINMGKTYLAVVGQEFFPNFDHALLAERDVSSTSSYAGAVAGPVASSYEIGEEDSDSNAQPAAPAAEPEPAPTEEITVDNHEHVFDARGNCTICGLYVYERDTYFFPPAEQQPADPPADQTTEQPPADQTAEPPADQPAEGDGGGA